VFRPIHNRILRAPSMITALKIWRAVLFATREIAWDPTTTVVNQAIALRIQPIVVFP